MNQNILIKGEPQKSKSALIVTIIGVLLILASFYVAIYVYLKVIRVMCGMFLIDAYITILL